MRKNNGPRKTRSGMGRSAAFGSGVGVYPALESPASCTQNHLPFSIYVKKKMATKQGMGQNISCLTQLNEEISETSQLVSIPNPLVRRRSGSDGSKGTVSRARVPKSDWDSTNEDSSWLFLNIA